MASDIEPEVSDIPILHEVVLPLDGEESRLPGGSFGTEPEEIAGFDDFGPNEPLFEIRVNDAGGWLRLSH